MASTGEELLRSIVTIQHEIVATGLKLDDVLQLVVRRVPELTPATGAAVEFEADGDLARRAASGTAAGTEGLRFGINDSLTGRVFQSGQGHVCEDAETDARVNQELAHRLGTRSMICVPLVSRGDRLGVLKAVSSQAHAFTEAHVETLQLLSGVVASALRNAHTFAKFEHDSRHDPLTGLRNRRAYDEQLLIEHERHARYGLPFSLVLFDLDRFKQVNDERGHLAGDAVLKSVAAAMSEGMRGVDCCYRIGGDEFAVILPNTTENSALIAAERLAEIIAEHEREQSGVTMSYGVGFSLEDEDALELHVRVDKALYDAKRRSAGRTAETASRRPARAEAEAVPVAQGLD